MSKQVLSGLRASAVVILVAVMSLLFFHFIPIHRIEAYYWHLRHGFSVAVDSYRFPVPKQWYVDHVSVNDVMIVNMKTGDGITVRTSSGPNRFTLPAWEALTSRSMPDGSTKVVGRKQLQVSGETVVCIEKNLDTKAVRLYPIECRSERGLEVTFQPYIFSTKDHDEMFYSLLQQVQKI